MALYTQDFLERARSANDIVQVVESYNVRLRRAGANMLGLCPFHNEKTPSFNVRTAEQFFRCFGCGAKGDVFRFVQLMERVEFPEAVRLLAERAGLPLEYESPARAGGAEKQAQAKTALLWCCSRALEYFEEELAGPSGAAARSYLLGRGFTPETIRQWRLGWAPDRWDGLSGYLLKNAGEIPPREKVLEQSVLAGVLRAKEGDRGEKRYYDAFRGRVMFPIVDQRFRPVAFGGRLLEEKPEAGGKYINSPEGRLFEKRRVLFGLAQAAKEISLTGRAVVVEGYTDVVMCHQHGIRNVVATLGTALTEDHAALLRRFVRENGGVVAFFDADAAGEKATRRALDLFFAQDVPLSVVRGLELKDACEFLPRFGAGAFRARLDAAEDGFAYLLRETLGAVRGRDVMAVGQAVRTVMDTVNRCPDPVKLALMRRRVAVEAGVPEETLPAAGGGRRSPAAPGRARPAGKRGLSMPADAGGGEMDRVLERKREAQRRYELRLLRYMWENPDWCARVADAYPPDEWRDPAAAEMAGLLRDQWDAGRAPLHGELRLRAGHPGAVELLADLAFSDSLPLKEGELSGLLLSRLDEDRREAARLLREKMLEAEKAGDDELLDRLQVEHHALQALMKKKTTRETE